MKEGLKNDSGKLRLDLLPPEALYGTTMVLMFGADKYGKNNYRQGIAYSRVFAALLRHLFAWWTGKEKDEESGLSHLHHAACCIMFLQTYAYHKRYIKFDDRTHRHID